MAQDGHEKKKGSTKTTAQDTPRNGRERRKKNKVDVARKATEVRKKKKGKFFQRKIGKKKLTENK